MKNVKSIIAVAISVSGLLLGTSCSKVSEYGFSKSQLVAFPLSDADQNAPIPEEDPGDPSDPVDPVDPADPTDDPTSTPTSTPTAAPTNAPTNTPTDTPTSTPTAAPTSAPTNTPTDTPTNPPVVAPPAPEPTSPPVVSSTPPKGNKPEKDAPAPQNNPPQGNQPPATPPLPAPPLPVACSMGIEVVVTEAVVSIKGQKDQRIPVGKKVDLAKIQGDILAGIGVTLPTSGSLKSIAVILEDRMIEVSGACAEICSEIKFPSANTSGLKFHAQSGVTLTASPLKIALPMDSALKANGNGKCMLHPEYKVSPR